MKLPHPGDDLERDLPVKATALAGKDASVDEAGDRGFLFYSFLTSSCDISWAESCNSEVSEQRAYKVAY